MVDHFVHYYDFYSNIKKKQGLLYSDATSWHGNVKKILQTMVVTMVATPIFYIQLMFISVSSYLQLKEWRKFLITFFP